MNISWSFLVRKTPSEVLQGINLITLYYTDLNDNHLPVNYRIYDKSEGKTKNDYFQDMLLEVLNWGVKPNFVMWRQLV